MDTDYKGWGGADSRRAFEQNKTFSIERLRFKATQKWRGGLFRRDADERSGAKTKARLDFGFGIELAPGGDPDASRGRTFDAFRAECRLKARVSPDDAAPRLTVFFFTETANRRRRDVAARRSRARAFVARPKRRSGGGYEDARAGPAGRVPSALRGKIGENAL